MGLQRLARAALPDAHMLRQGTLRSSSYVPSYHTTSTAAAVDDQRRLA